MELTKGQVAVVTGGGERDRAGAGRAASRRPGCTSCSADVQDDALAAAAAAAAGPRRRGAAVQHRRQQGGRRAGPRRADARPLRRRPRRVQQRRRGRPVRPVVRPDQLVGVGHGRQLLGRRPRLPGVPPPPRRRRAHRQHGVDRRPDARASDPATTRRSTPSSRSPRTSSTRSRWPSCRSASACCARAGCAPTSSRPTATGRPSSARSRPTTRPTPSFRQHVDAGPGRGSHAGLGRRRRRRRHRGRPVLGHPAPGLPRHRHRPLGDDRRARRPGAAPSTSPACRRARRSSPRSPAALGLERAAGRRHRRPLDLPADRGRIMDVDRSSRDLPYGPRSDLRGGTEHEVRRARGAFTSG